MIAGILWPIIFSDDTCENTKTECQREGERAGSEVDNIPPDFISRANKTEHKSNSILNLNDCGIYIRNSHFNWFAGREKEV